MLDWINTPTYISKEWVNHLESNLKKNHIINEHLFCKVENGTKIKLGKDPWIDIKNKFILSPPLINFLNKGGKYTLNQIARDLALLKNQIWASTEDLLLEGDFVKA